LIDQPQGGAKSVVNRREPLDQGAGDNAALEGRETLSLLVLMYRRFAAALSIIAFTHGSRRGLQIFRRSAVNTMCG
jgi:hypothetical protein